MNHTHWDTTALVGFTTEYTSVTYWWMMVTGLLVNIQVSALTNAITSQLDWQEDKLDCLDFPLPVHTMATANSKAVVDRRETTPPPQAGTDHSVRCDGRCTSVCLVDMSTLNTPWLAIFAHCVLTVCFSLSFLRWGDERVRDGGREDVRDGGRED